MRIFTASLLVAVALAGCSGNGGTRSDTATGTFTLAITDSLATGELVLQGVFLRDTGAQWRQAVGNGTDFDFVGSGGNLTKTGDVRAGDYDRLRLSFASLKVGDRQAKMTTSGVEFAINLTVPKGGTALVNLTVSWAESLFESADGLAFTPILTKLVVTIDGVETLRLEASEIATTSGKAPVARMRIFDATGLEAFVSTFVAESPEDPAVANAGNLTFSGTASEPLQKGATIKSYSWDIDGEKLTGNTVVWTSPVNGGNFTVRLEVEDSEGNRDLQVVSLAIRPAIATRTYTFSGTARGAGGTQGVVEHLQDVNATGLEGSAANVTHVRLVLTPGAATVPFSDLDVTLDDAAAKRIGAQTGSGSQHKIDVDVKGLASGNWKIRVIPDPAVDAAYTVTLTITWTGYNPGMEAFLATYDDGHSHEH